MLRLSEPDLAASHLKRRVTHLTTFIHRLQVTVCVLPKHLLFRGIIQRILHKGSAGGSAKSTQAASEHPFTGGVQVPDADGGALLLRSASITLPLTGGPWNHILNCPENGRGKKLH